MILQIGTIIETSLTPRENYLRRLEYMNMIPNCSIPDKSTKDPTNTNEYYKKLVTPRKGIKLLTFLIQIFNPKY